MSELSVRPFVGKVLHSSLDFERPGDDGVQKNLEDHDSHSKHLPRKIDLERTDIHSIPNGEPKTFRISPPDIVQEIIDIRNGSSTTSLANMIRDGLKKSNGRPKSLPPLTLWDNNGLNLFEQITHLPDYYLSRAERDIIVENCKDIAQRICCVSLIVDLGCGDTQKTAKLLQTLDDMCLPIDYYALDLSPISLRSSLARLSFRHIHCHGLLGTFDDAKIWLQSPAIRTKSKCLLSLGSTVGNMPRDDALSFLQGFAATPKSPSKPLPEQHFQLLATAQTHPAFFIIIGLDSCTNANLIDRAYADPDHLNARFILNALTHANTVLDYQAFNPEEWTVQKEWINGGYFQYLVPLVDGVEFEGVSIQKGEQVQVVQSLKYDGAQQQRLWEAAGLKIMGGWACRDKVFGADPMVSLLKVGEELGEAGNDEG